jgi:hypothetical protein
MPLDIARGDMSEEVLVAIAGGQSMDGQHDFCRV